MKGIYIGSLAKNVGVDAPTIRFYEKEGLLSSPLRSGGGYRLYSEQDREALEFIKSAQGLGLSLKEIKKILKAREVKGKACDHVAMLLQDKISDFDRQALEMKRISLLFKNLLRQWKTKKNKRKTCICDDLAQKSKARK